MEGHGHRRRDVSPSWLHCDPAGTEASIEYIQSYRGTPDTLDASLERIRATAQRLSTELDAIRFDAEHESGAF